MQLKVENDGDLPVSVIFVRQQSATGKKCFSDVGSEHIVGPVNKHLEVKRKRSNFKALRFGLMVGIGGGVSSAEADIRLGDVVVSKPHRSFGGRDLR
jgi:hypothetical protein